MLAYTEFLRLAAIAAVLCLLVRAKPLDVACVGTSTLAQNYDAVGTNVRAPSFDREVEDLTSFADAVDARPSTCQAQTRDPVACDQLARQQ